MKKESVLFWVFIVVVFALFILMTFITNTYFEEIREFLGTGIVGMLIFVVALILEVVFAPFVTLIPLIPVGTALWGWKVSGLLTLIGWLIGSSIVFYIAREFGKPYLKERKILKSVYKYEDIIPDKNIFWGIVMLRVFLPFDIISYAIGLFSRVNFKNYFLATLIGLAPLSFLLAYGASISFRLQIIFMIVGIVLVFLFIFFSRKYAGIRKKVSRKFRKSF